MSGHQEVNRRLPRLARRFRLQQEFATGYSPLYARLFKVLAEWLDTPGAGDDPLVNWLLEASAGRGSLDVSLLLPAGLHHDILALAAGQEIPSVSQLALYFPTAGGDKTPEAPGFESALRQAIMARRPSLSEIIGTGKVQTNETGRGLCWLLPLLASRWEAIRLVDVGASAGLNLVADYRAYRLVDEVSDEALVDVGRGRPVQFLVRCQSGAEFLQPLQSGEPPTVISRTGCDLAPFRLAGEADELTLMSFVWGDQADRLQRLREGIAALREVEQKEGGLALYPADLPEELDAFLRDRVPNEAQRPVVLYNTFMTAYLSDKGASLWDRIDAWAAGQQRPVLWLQWEPARDGRDPPGLGWCAWTADLWHGQAHRRWRLGWAHPHGTELELGPGLGAFAAATQP
jgi:hypothetical protein